MMRCFLSNSLSLRFLIIFYREAVEICEYALFKSLNIFPVPVLKTLAKLCLHTVLGIQWYCLALGLFHSKCGSATSKEFFILL